jgi:hypothetical protein
MKEQCALHMRTCKRYGELTLRGGLRAFILACSRSKKASVFAESSGRSPHCSPFIHLALLAFHPHRSPSIADGTFASTAVEALANVRCLLAKPSNKIVSQQGTHAPALRLDPRSFSRTAGNVKDSVQDEIFQMLNPQPLAQHVSNMQLTLPGKSFG